VVSGNIVLDRGPVLPTGGEIWGYRNPQFAAVSPVAILRYERTDGRTTYDSNTALALRASRGNYFGLCLIQMFLF